MPEITDKPIFASNPTVKLSFELIKWIITVAFGAALIYSTVIYETKDHSDIIYLKKEVFFEIQSTNQRSLERIENKLDKLIEKKSK